MLCIFTVIPRCIFTWFSPSGRHKIRCFGAWVPECIHFYVLRRTQNLRLRGEVEDFWPLGGRIYAFLRWGALSGVSLWHVFREAWQADSMHIYGGRILEKLDKQILCIETNYLYPLTHPPTHPHRGRGVFLSRTLPKNRGVLTCLKNFA